MKTLSFFASALGCFLFLFFIPTPNCTAHSSSDHLLIGLVVAPKKVAKKKRHWKKKLGITFLEKRFQKKIQKLQAKQKIKGKRLQTHPLAIFSFFLIPVGILLAAFFSPISTSLAILIAFAFSITAIISGIVSLNKMKKKPEQYVGRRIAILGIVLGAIGLFFFSGFLYLISLLIF